MLSKFFLMSLSHIIGWGWGGHSLKGVAGYVRTGCPGSVTITRVPTMWSHHARIPLPSSPSPANPNPREDGSGRGSRPVQLSREGQERSMDMWAGGAQGSERRD